MTSRVTLPSLPTTTSTTHISNTLSSSPTHSLPTPLLLFPLHLIPTHSSSTIPIEWDPVMTLWSDRLFARSRIVKKRSRGRVISPDISVFTPTKGKSAHRLATLWSWEADVDRPFECLHRGCGKSFIQRSALTVHIRVQYASHPRLLSRISADDQYRRAPTCLRGL